MAESLDDDSLFPDGAWTPDWDEPARPVMLDMDARDRLLLVMESSLRVRNSSSFFVWTQGALQAVMPHEILICALGKGPNRGSQIRWFSSSRYFQEHQFRSVTDPRHGLIPKLMADWMESGRPHFLVNGNMTEDIATRLQDAELRNLIGHGVRGGDPNYGGYFCFCRTQLDRSRQNAHLLELITPYVYSAFCRILAEESRSAVSPATTAMVVTAREEEILHLIKDGKTTADIAKLLALSPFTVRNHVKNIFRKLGACTRSQAVAQAISHGILAHNYS